MKAQDIRSHIDGLGVVTYSIGIDVSVSVFELSKYTTLFLYGDETWALRTHDITNGITDILDNEVMNAVAMTDHELLSQIEEEIMKGKLEVM